MVLVHGGDFYYDSAVMYNESYLLGSLVSKGLVVVIPAYRIGGLGFLYLDDAEVIPRNLGFLGELFFSAYSADLVEALRWIQREISVFGGDKNVVSIIGDSAGGGIALGFAFSPVVRNENLFHRAIGDSSSFPFNEPQRVRDVTRNYLRRLEVEEAIRKLFF